MFAVAGRAVLPVVAGAVVCGGGSGAVTVSGHVCWACTSYWAPVALLTVPDGSLNGARWLS